MMPAEQNLPPLIERLPAVRGQLEADASLARFTWFKVGGPAEVLFRPADAEDLIDLLAAKPPEVPVTVMGNASNLLIRDGGLPGIVIRLGRGFSQIHVEGSEIVAGAAVADLNVARRARDEGLAGLEFLAGVPGTVGGALRMNAGAYGAEVKDILISAEAADGTGRRRTFDAADLGLSYRHCSVSEDWIFLAARFRGMPGKAAAIGEHMDEIQSAREASQPVRTPTGGSTFRNPPGAKAWELIDRAGCRGLRRGGAMVSEQHCNFLINAGGATAADLEGLGEEVRRRVKDTTGMTLEWEIRRIGEVAGSPREVPVGTPGEQEP